MQRLKLILFISSERELWICPKLFYGHLNIREVLLCVIHCWVIHDLSSSDFDSLISFISMSLSPKSMSMQSTAKIVQNSIWRLHSSNENAAAYSDAIFLYLHWQILVFEWSLLILARTLIRNRIWTIHMQFCKFSKSHKFELASMDFWYTHTMLGGKGERGFNSQSFSSSVKLSSFGPMSFYGWLERKF